MNEIAFFDTNILLYISDRRDRLKREIAQITFNKHLESHTLAISTQVVQEFYSVAIKKLRMAPLDAASEVEALCGLTLVTVGCTEILRAIGIERRYRISFWDALIVSAAESAGAATLLTEDLSHGQQLGSVRVVNPFLMPPA